MSKHAGEQPGARALAMLERVTADLAASRSGDRRSPGVRTLRQALGCGWSVVVAALPADGLAAFDRLSASDDPDVAWVVRENRKKVRLKHLLADRD